MSDEYNRSHRGRGAAHITYGCYALGIFTGLPAVVGVLIAFFSNDEAEPLYKAHLNYAISAFVWSLPLAIIGIILVWTVILSLIGIGFLTLSWLYLLYKTVRGWLRLIDQEPPPGYS